MRQIINYIHVIKKEKSLSSILLSQFLSIFSCQLSFSDRRDGSIILSKWVRIVPRIKYCWMNFSPSPLCFSSSRMATYISSPINLLLRLYTNGINPIHRGEKCFKVRNDLARYNILWNVNTSAFCGNINRIKTTTSAINSTIFKEHRC